MVGQKRTIADLRRLKNTPSYRVSQSEAQLGLLLGGGAIYYFVRVRGGVKLLHADLAVFNSNRFFVLVFLQNLYFQQL